MSDYERQIEEALARKARESERNRKKVQSEARLMSSLKDAFAETGTAPEPDRKSLSTENLESLLAESTKKRSSRETDGSRAFAEAVNDSLKREMAASRPVKTETEKQEETVPEELGQTAEKMGLASALKRETPVEIPDSILNEEEPKKPMRFHRSDDEERTVIRRDPGSFVLAVLLTLFLAAAGIGGSLFYTLYTFLPMANAVNNSSCAEVFEGDYIAGLNSLAEEENLNIAFTREVLVGGQAVRDIKGSLKAAYSGSSYQPDTERIGGKISAYAGAAGVGLTDGFTGKALELYSSILAETTDSSWVGQTGVLRTVLLLIAAAGTAASVVLLVFLGRRGTAGSLTRFSFAGAALLIELLSVLVMVTGVFRRYNAAYAYITVLSDKYLMGAIVACMGVGAFFMVLAACAAVLSSKE